MGIDLASWRARIGLNYCNMCRPLQTRWRSSGCRLYQPGVASWGVGEVMSDTPLVLKGCMTVVALSLILQYVVHSWLKAIKLRAKGGGGKVHCHWQGSAFQVKGILLLRAIMVVIPLLLVIAGDVETNPGPGEPSLIDLLEELHPVCTSWYNIGLLLHIPHTTLDRFKQMYTDPLELMREMLKHWLDTTVDPPPTWEAVISALKSPLVNKMNVAALLESKYCSPVQYDMREEPSYHNQMEMKKEVHDQASLGSYKTQIHACSTPAFEIPTTSAARYIGSFEPVQKNPQLDVDTVPGGIANPPPSESSQKLPFGCGCSKPCKFFSFIEGGCPTPIPSASSFPYLDLSGLTHEQQQELRGRLRSDTQEIMMQFQELVSSTIKSFKRQCVPLDELVSHVITLGAFDPVFKKPQAPLFQYCFQRLEAADTIPKVFLALKNYLSFFNYHILEHIIKELGTEEDKAELQRYKDYFNQYAKKRIFECLPEFGPVSDIDHADIFVKLDSLYDNYTVAQIEEFRHKLSKILHLSSQGILRLCRVEKGCIQLRFQVPLFVQQEIFPLSREQERVLADVGVIKLTCGEYKFLRDESTQIGVDKRDDPDGDSGIGPSMFSDTRSTTFSELSRERERIADITRLRCEEYHFLKNEPSQSGVVKKHYHDTDNEFGMVHSTFADANCDDGFPEDCYHKKLKELEYERRVQSLVETASFHKLGSGLELHHVAATGKLEDVRLLVETNHCDPMEEDQNDITAFHLAAIVGNVQVFKYFVTECNCHPASPGPFRLTPLHLASEQGHLDVVKYLVTEQKMDLLCEDEYGNTPLHRACASGCWAVVEFLTSEHKVYNPITKLVSDLKNKWNSTPIHNATWKGHLDILKFFISGQNCDSDLPGRYGDTPLHYAAECGHLHIVKYLANEQSCNPSCLDDEKFTPLHLAAWKGHIDIVKFLTKEKNCDPMCRNHDQNTPLHMAAHNGHMEVVTFLTLEMKCDPMCRDFKQDTPLHMAANHGHIDIVKFLTLEMHCDPTSANAGNVTALHLSVMKGHLDILRFLTIDKNCDPNLPGQYGQTPLHTAAECGHLNIVKYLIDEQECNPSCLDDMECTPLHCAAAKGHMDIVNLLIVKHCESVCRDSNLNTPLHMAALGGSLDIVKFLTLEMHCDPKSRNSNCETALHSAVVKGHLDIVQFFISNKNCDSNIRGQYGRTLLHYAAEFGHLHIVKYLIDEQGCNPSCLDEYKYTPLHCTAVAGYIDIVKFLTVEKQCDPMCRDSTQSTPLHMAATEGHREVVKFLAMEKHCNLMYRDLNLNTPLHRAAGNGHKEIVKFLTLEMHCDPRSKNTDNNNALHIAVINGHLDILQFFISDQNCDPNLPGQYGGTPLHIAATCGHLQIVKYLTDEQDCNPSCLNEYNHTPLHCAAKEGNIDIIKFLLVEKNCDPLSRNIYGNTAFHCAVLGGHLEIVKFLIEELKCPPDITGQHNVTPFQMALYEKQADIAQYLQKHSVIPYIYIAIAMVKQLGF